MVSLDATNAFNSIDRTHLRSMVKMYVPRLLSFFDWAYQQEVVGWWNGNKILPFAGVK